MRGDEERWGRRCVKGDCFPGAAVGVVKMEGCRHY